MLVFKLEIVVIWSVQNDFEFLIKYGVRNGFPFSA